MYLEDIFGRIIVAVLLNGCIWKGKKEQKCNTTLTFVKRCCSAEENLVT